MKFLTSLRETHQPEDSGLESLARLAQGAPGKLAL